jgi:hypothetical protein
VTYRLAVDVPIDLELALALACDSGDCELLLSWALLLLLFAPRAPPTAPPTEAAITTTLMNAITVQKTHGFMPPIF